MADAAYRKYVSAGDDAKGGDESGEEKHTVFEGVT